MTQIVTKASLITLLEKPHLRIEVIGRACVVLFKNQTAAEQSANTTQVHNNKGFTAGDAYSGSLTAKYFMKHNTLEEWQVNKWMKRNVKGEPRLSKYWGQLNVAAEEKAKGC